MRVVVLLPYRRSSTPVTDVVDVVDFDEVVPGQLGTGSYSYSELYARPRKIVKHPIGFSAPAPPPRARAGTSVA